MPLLLLALIILAFIGCASTSRQAEPEPLPECRAGEFRGSGIGQSENEALAEAHSALARQINSSVNVTIERMVNQRISNGEEDLNSKYESRAVIESSLPNAHDARIAGSRRNGNKINVAVCMSRADAAKPYIQRQSLLLDSLEFMAVNELNAAHPRQKSEARNKANAVWAGMLANDGLLKNWGAASDMGRAKDLHDAIEDDYKDYCQTAKLHWNPERKTPYSEIVFSKLSSSIKMEKSPCAGRGISLFYRDSEPECSMKFGLNTCSYALSLSLATCDGTEYLQLESDAMGAHQKPDFALEKLQGNLKSAEFWNKWLQEIKQWSPQCE
jgi:hypothetical protein